MNRLAKLFNPRTRLVLGSVGATICFFSAMVSVLTHNLSNVLTMMFFLAINIVSAVFAWSDIDEQNP